MKVKNLVMAVMSEATRLSSESGCNDLTTPFGDTHSMHIKLIHIAFQ